MNKKTYNYIYKTEKEYEKEHFKKLFKRTKRDTKKVYLNIWKEMINKYNDTSDVNISSEYPLSKVRTATDYGEDQEYLDTLAIYNKYIKTSTHNISTIKGIELIYDNSDNIYFVDIKLLEKSLKDDGFKVTTKNEEIGPDLTVEISKKLIEEYLNTAIELNTNNKVYQKK